eukprot:s3555_g3.t1
MARLHRWPLVLVSSLWLQGVHAGSDTVLLRQQVSEQSPSARREYRFSVLRTREGATSSRISELMLADATAQAMALKDPRIVSEVAIGSDMSGDKASMDDPLKCMDDDTSTSLLLSSGQYVIVKIRPGVLVGGFGFKTSGEKDWRCGCLERREACGWMRDARRHVGYATPEERSILVGPFIVSRLSALALLGNRTLPEAAVAAPAEAPAAASKNSKPFEVPSANPSVPMPAPVSTTSLDGAGADMPDTHSKVAQAVLRASKANGLDNAATAATAAAVSAASDALAPAGSQPESLSKVAEAAAAMGLTDAQVASVSSAFRSVHPDHWDTILNAWTAAATASAKAASNSVASTPEAKVAAVVAATGDAGFTVQQQAAAAAESAVPAALQGLQGTTTASPASVVGQALAGADIPPEDKAAVVDAASEETLENQKAVADVLSAAGMLPTTTEQPETVDLNDPNVRLVMDAVSQKLADARIVNAAADALAKASTTPFDAWSKLLQSRVEETCLELMASAAACCCQHEIQSFGWKPRIAAEAPQLSADQQVSVATALDAAGDLRPYLSSKVQGIDDGLAAKDGVEKVMGQTMPKPAEKVAAVVKAEAAAGMTDGEQADSAAIAVAAAAAASQRVDSAEGEAGIFKEIVAAGIKASQLAQLSQEQVESILSVVAPMPPEDQVAVKEHLEALDVPPVQVVPFDVTSLPPVPLDGLPADSAPFLPQTDVGRMPSTSTVPEAIAHSSGSASQFVFGVDQTGVPPKGFMFQVALNSQGVMEFLRGKTGWVGDPHELSIALGRFRFDWPMTSCSDEEIGFTDFQSVTFYNATFANPGDECGTLVATTVDVAGAVRFPRAGDTSLFWLAGQFGTKYPLTGGDQVMFSLLDLVIVASAATGEKVEYSICGDPTLATYVGCPEQSMLKIKYPENNLGQGVKICSGQAHFHEYRLENCFTV